MNWNSLNTDLIASDLLYIPSNIPESSEQKAVISGRCKKALELVKECYCMQGVGN